MTTIETPRLVLREFNIADAPFVLELLNEPSFLRYIGDKKVRTLEDACDYLLNGPIATYQRHGFGLYQVELKETRMPIGMCGLLKREELPQPDIGFAFLPDYRNKGFAFEAAAGVLKDARERLQLDRILAIVNPNNEASIKLLEKLGMKFEETKGDVKLYAVPHQAME